MSNKKITDLASYSANQVNPYDLLFITDIDHQETKKITAAELASYGDLTYGTTYKTGSFSGSFIGTASYADNSRSSSYIDIANSSISASYAENSRSSSYALTSSYALNGGSGGGTANFNEIITLATPHGFSIGDAVFETGVTRNYYQATSVWTGPNNIANEVIGVIQSTSSAYTFTVVWGGVVDFGVNIPSYFQSQNGYAYFLSGSQGKLNITDPATVDSVNHISKPVLLKINSTSAYMINQRGLYTAANQVTVESASYADNSRSSSYALSASYALNGGGGGSVTNAYYIDTIPIGTIITCASGSAPAGYLPCDGTYYTISSFQELYTAIQQDINTNANVKFGIRSSYNTANNSYISNTGGTFFNVPDLRGIFVRGFNNGLVNGNGNLGGLTSPYDGGSGRKFGTLQTGDGGSHWHGTGWFPSDNDDGELIWRPYSGATTTGGTHQVGQWVGQSGANQPQTGNRDNAGKTGTTDNINLANSDVRPVNLVLNYYIKAKQINLDNATLQSVANGTYPMNGDVVGSINQNTVTRIQNIPVSSGAPTVGSILQYNGSVWSPSGQSSKTINGYTYLPGGIIMQWGTYSLPSGNGTTNAVTFSIAFPTMILSYWVSVDNAAGQMIGIALSPAPTTTGMTIQKGASDSTARAGKWFAIGY